MRRLGGEESSLDTIIECVSLAHQGTRAAPTMKMLTIHSLVWLMSISWGTWELVLYCVLHCTVLYCTWESCSAVEAHTTTVPWAKAPRVAGKEDCESQDKKC